MVECPGIGGTSGRKVWEPNTAYQPWHNNKKNFSCGITMIAMSGDRDTNTSDIRNNHSQNLTHLGKLKT